MPQKAMLRAYSCAYPVDKVLSAAQMYKPADLPHSPEGRPRLQGPNPLADRINNRFHQKRASQVQYKADECIKPLHRLG
jgi:hypothetical protein